MENTEKIKIIKYHNNLLGFDCPCVLRATGKFEIHDPSRMPRDDEELEQWRVEMVTDKLLKEQKQTIINLVKYAEYHFITGSRWPDDGKWAAWVGKLWAIYDSAEVKELPVKPY